jgi:hypothetical protein
MIDIEDSVEGTFTSNNKNGLIKSKFDSFFSVKTKRRRKSNDGRNLEELRDVEESKELESVLPWSEFLIF